MLDKNKNVGINKCNLKIFRINFLILLVICNLFQFDYEFLMKFCNYSKADFYIYEKVGS